MAANWFEIKVKYTKVNEFGKEKKALETYLLDSMSFTEAERRITEKLKEIIQYDFHVTSIKPSNISEIVESKDTKDDKWFKAKVAIIDADTITGREKRSNVYFLVAGSDVNVALENLHKSLSTYLVPTDVIQVGDSNIMDVFPYFEDKQE